MNTLPKNCKHRGTGAVPTLLAGLCALALASPVQAAKYRVVSRFKGEGFTHSSAVPLIQGTNGAIWGTTPRGGGYGVTSFLS